MNCNVQVILLDEQKVRKERAEIHDGQLGFCKWAAERLNYACLLEAKFTLADLNCFVTVTRFELEHIGRE